MRFIFLLLLASNSALCQQVTMKGIIVNEKKEPLPYVNIGMLAHAIGTITNETGQYRLSLPDSIASDSLWFSCIGYHLEKRSVRDMMHTDTLILSENLKLIKEVVITPGKWKLRIRGVTHQHPMLQGMVMANNNTDIVEFAQKVETHHQVCQVQKAAIFLRNAGLDSALFRINFYASRDGLPDQQIVDKTILQKVAIHDDWAVFNLEKYHIALDQDFFVGFEFLPTQPITGPPFHFGGVFTGAYYKRISSLGKWSRNAGISLSAWVEVLN